MSSETTIAIVGGGCSGLLVAVQLRRQGFGGAVVVVEPHGELGRGLAYSTTFSEHLLNVPAGKMSALPDVPDDFLEWLRERNWPGAGPATFAPRQLYGEYLGELTGRHGVESVRHVRAEVGGIAVTGKRARLRLSDGATIEADRVVLALGNPASGPELDVETSGMEDRWHLSPWVGDALRLRAPGERILLLGSGLTAIDAVLALQSQGSCRTILVSRRGNLPQTHRMGLRPAEMPPLQSRTLRGMFRELRAQIAYAREQDLCWRAAIDALRPVSNQLWQELPLRERESFLRRVKTYWETHRHRMAPQIRERIDGYRAEGRMEVIAGRLRESVARAGGIDVRIARRGGGEQAMEVDRIISCTGIQENYRNHPRKLIASLVREGVAAPNDLGIGFRTDGGGALVGADGRVSEVLFTLGPPRRGELIETTAVPEIRMQAEELARRLVERC